MDTADQKSRLLIEQRLRLQRQVDSYRARSEHAAQEAEKAIGGLIRLLLLASGAAAGSILVWLADAAASHVALGALVLAAIAISLFVVITFVGFLLVDGYALRQHSLSSHSQDMAFAAEDADNAYASALIAGLPEPHEDDMGPIKARFDELSNEDPYSRKELMARAGPSLRLTIWLAKHTRRVLLISAVGFVVALGCTIAAIFWNNWQSDEFLTRGGGFEVVGDQEPTAAE